MTEEFDFIAPDGSAIEGTRETVPGTCAVTFTGPNPAEPGNYDHRGGTEMGWDGQETATIAGAPIFEDSDFAPWLAHHLIPAGALSLSPETIELFHREMTLGRALDAVNAAREALEACDYPDSDEDLSLVCAVQLDSLYERAKQASLEARAVELKRQAEAVRPVIAEPITDLASAKAWIEGLAKAGLGFHFDDVGEETIINVDTGRAIFSEAEMAVLRLRVARLRTFDWGEDGDAVGYLNKCEEEA